MQLYPTLPQARSGTIVRDVLAVLAICAFIFVGVKVHDAVDQLAILGSGVSDAGGAVRSGFRDAAGAVNGVPLVGHSLGDGLQSAGNGAGGPLEDVGHQGEQSAHHLANLLGTLAALLPSLLLLAYVLPPRIRQVRGLSAAARVLADPTDPVRREAIAQRAAFNLPYRTLLRYTRDPLGDLQNGNLDPLVRAAIEEAGLRVALPARAGAAT